MSNAIIIHGKPQKATYLNRDLPSSSNSIWIPWLQKELLLLDIPTQTPEMFNAWQPDYHVWAKEFERHDITVDTLLVGHSIGAGFIMQWISEHTDVAVGHVFLVAPSFGDKFNITPRLEYPTTNGFFEFELDPNLYKRVKSITIFHSDNDRERVIATVKHIREVLPSTEYREFHNYGHFRGKRDMPSDEFPELLETIKSKSA